MNRTVLLFLALTSIVLNFVSCKKEGPGSKDNPYTNIEITVENEKGEKIDGQYVKMFDENSYELFKKDHFTRATAESMTNKDGIATFTLENSKWFNNNSSIELMFVVVEHIDNNNYRFSSNGGTISKNINSKFTITFPIKETTINPSLVIENNILRKVTDKTLTSIILPPNVKEIANNVFERSNITEIILNEGIEKIGDECFLNSKIKSINFPSSLKYIGRAAFQDCIHIESTDLSKTQVESIPEAAFLDSGLKEIILPSNLKEISSEAFCGTNNLKNITINESVTEIGIMAFYKSGLTSLTLHNNLKQIGYMAFADCINMSKIEKASKSGNNEGFIDIGAFHNCISLTEATLPDNIIRLEGYTFIECKKLNKLSLPKNLKSIGDQGLTTNYNINSITFNSIQIPGFINDKGEPASQVLPFSHNINIINVPKQSVEEYKRTFTSYANKIQGV
ncbi:leucine-rich repeat protein [Bacteroides caecigallinarum]|uniref:leucine-rich repeat domain-containing protein n=1 Tax=Bacteroides caecigallinarum TaxID=1411144 RepID=UPI00195D3299|nr:leucine-rich repeat domain-containing protein [Bacteroides caecigallinarum]MBM6866497.1 leucine-rich repeat protein [Bacteroides caecigallinarum]